MTVKLENARIEVEIDVAKAKREAEEIESQLDRARGRRDRTAGPGGREREARKRESQRRRPGVGAASVAGAAAAGGLRKAAGFAAGAAGVAGVAAIISQLPTLIPPLIDALKTNPSFREFLRKEIIPDIPFVPGDQSVTGEDLADKIAKLAQDTQDWIAWAEASIHTSLAVGQTIADLAAEGKGVEMAAGIYEKLKALPRSGSRGLFAIGQEVSEAEAIISTHWAYNQARARMKQAARQTEWSANIDRQMEGYRAGMSR